MAVWYSIFGPFYYFFLSFMTADIELRMVIFEPESSIPEDQVKSESSSPEDQVKLESQVPRTK